jgi:hypothetical protein
MRAGSKEKLGGKQVRFNCPGESPTFIYTEPVLATEDERFQIRGYEN